MRVAEPEPLGPNGLLRGTLRRDNGRSEYALAGELDLASAKALCDRLRLLAAETTGDVCLDLGELRFLGSTGIRSLLSAEAELSGQGRRLVLRNVGGMPRRVLALTGLEEQLNVE